MAPRLPQAEGMSSIRPGERRAGCGFAHSGPVKVCIELLGLTCAN